MAAAAAAALKRMSAIRFPKSNCASVNSYRLFSSNVCVNPSGNEVNKAKKTRNDILNEIQKIGNLTEALRCKVDKADAQQLMEIKKNFDAASYDLVKSSFGVIGTIFPALQRAVEMPPNDYGNEFQRLRNVMEELICKIDKVNKVDAQQPKPERTPNDNVSEFQKFRNVFEELRCKFDKIDTRQSKAEKTPNDNVKEYQKLRNVIEELICKIDKVDAQQHSENGKN